MWCILGEDAIYLDVPYKFKKILTAIAPEDEKGIRFKKLMEKTDVSFMINGETEENCFILKVPEEYTPEDIQFMADEILAYIIKNGKAPVVANGVEQEYKIIISNEKDPELIGIRKTPGMSSGEIFKPIVGGWASPGKANPSTVGRYGDE